MNEKDKTPPNMYARFMNVGWCMWQCSLKNVQTSKLTIITNLSKYHSQENTLFENGHWKLKSM